MAPIDPHSYTDSAHPLTTFIDLNLKVDFVTKIISGTARLKLASKASGILYLDTRDLTIENVTDTSGNSVRYSLAKTADKIKGTLLEVYLEDDEVTITYRTSPSATALQWLAPQQTAGGQQPYVFTQCQPIHARSVLPCQDTPLARIKYSAAITVPVSAGVVMGAASLGREEKGETAVERFAMEQPIPPYLFALAAGDITFADISNRCRVYAEPSVVKAGAYEFGGMEDMVQTAERLFGPYEWEKFNVLVMPPSFPYGGMENPRMTFLTPTIVVGDRSLVTVVAHELAHSWTGNLISNATANDFWLNEGWTTYAQRRIIEAMDGQEESVLDACIGWSALLSTVADFSATPQYTQLKMDLEGVDPDQVYSQVPYEKGYLFVARLEAQVGRAAFDPFIQKYIAKFQFQSITTETFIDFLTSVFPTIGKEVDLEEWVHGQGIPADAIEPKSKTLTKVKSLAEGFAGGLDLTADDVAKWRAAEWQIYLEALPLVLPHDRIAALDAQFSLSTSPNSELRVGFLTIAANSAYAPCYSAIQKSLNTIGRMKYLTPLYKGLIAGGQKELAWKIFQEAKDKYHPVAQAVVAGLFNKAA